MVLVGCCYGLGVTFVIFGAHIDKVEVDTEKGIHTLPMVLGDKNARYFSLGAYHNNFFVAYISYGYITVCTDYIFGVYQVL